MPMNAGAHGERRRTDRRSADRRQRDAAPATRPATEESLFGALGDTAFHADDMGDAQSAVPSQADAQRQRTREARRVASSSDTALRRVFRTYVAARAVLGLLLALVPWIVTLPSVHNPLPLILVCLGYAVQSITLWLLPRLRAGVEQPPMTRLGRRQWVATIGFDVLVFAALHLFDPAANLNF
ncbi:MAG TPA: histidine kinase, partial [Burkholderiaceae bacterium]|nr:histidine kinase [Burkholderiaceae bacterium]